MKYDVKYLIENWMYFVKTTFYELYERTNSQRNFCISLWECSSLFIWAVSELSLCPLSKTCPRKLLTDESCSWNLPFYLIASNPRITPAHPISAKRSLRGIDLSDVIGTRTLWSQGVTTSFNKHVSILNFHRVLFHW